MKIIEMKVNTTHEPQIAIKGETSFEEVPTKIFTPPNKTAVRSAKTTPFSTLDLKCSNDLIAVRTIPRRMSRITITCIMLKLSFRKNKLSAMVIGSSASSTTSMMDNFPSSKALKLNIEEMNKIIPNPIIKIRFVEFCKRDKSL